MKKLIFIFFLSIAFACQGQVLRTNPLYVSPVTVAGYCAEYQAIYNAYAIKPGADTANSQNTLVVELKAAGWWAKADLIYWFGQSNEAAALLMWLAPAGDDNVTNTTAAPFTKYRGFTGVSATTECMTTNWTPATEAVHFTQDDAAVSVYTRLDLDEAGCIVGVVNLTKYITLIPSSAGSQIACRLNSDAEKTHNITEGNGLTTVVRTSSVATEYFKNATAHGANPDATSTGLANDDLTILCRDGTDQWSNNQVLFIYVGASLTATEITDGFTAIEKAADFIGAGVVP